MTKVTINDAPSAQAVHGRTGCFLCLAEIASRPPRPLADEEVLDLGGLRVRWLDTPHVPAPKLRVCFRALKATATASPELAVRVSVSTATTGLADFSV